MFNVPDEPSESAGFRPLRVGDEVVILQTPFENFDAVIDEINEARKSALVRIPIFGRHPFVVISLDALARREA